MPLILNRNDVAGLLTADDAMLSARDAFTALSLQQVEMPQRIATRVPDHSGTHLSMPCYVRTVDQEILSIKVATVFEENPARGLPSTLGFLMLQDPETGSLLALLDAEHLTAMRTAAASALAIDLLAPKCAATMALFGAGGQAKAHLDVLMTVRELERVFVVARTQESAERFCAASIHGAKLIPTTDREYAVRNSTIICTTTNSTTPVFDGSWLRPGTVIAASGAFRPDMRELDDLTIGSANIVVDQVSAARNGAGDLIQAGVDWSTLIELGDLLLGFRHIGREMPYRVFKSVGLAVQDAFLAAIVYKKALAAKVGIDVRLD